MVVYSLFDVNKQWERIEVQFTPPPHTHHHLDAYFHFCGGGRVYQCFERKSSTPLVAV